MFVFDSVTLIVRIAVDQKHRNSMPGCRRKMTKTDISEFLHICLLCLHLENVLIQDHAVPKEHVDLQSLVLQDDHHFIRDLQDILSDKKSPLNVSEIQACKDILKAHRARTEDSNPSEAVSRNVAAANLEKEELDILLKQMEHDLKTYALWQLKCEDREAAMYHAELAQKTSRHQAIRRNARDLLDMKSPEWRASIKVLEKPETAYSDIRHSVQSLSKLFHCPSSDVAVVTLCNWSASVSKAQTQKNQASVMGACINDSTAPLNIGLMLQPAMSSKRGSLWKEEEAARKVLANSNLNMDTCFCIVFDSKVDLREMRPGDFLITLSLCWGIF